MLIVCDTREQIVLALGVLQYGVGLLSLEEHENHFIKES